MSGVNANSEQIKIAYKICQEYIQMVDKTKKELSCHMSELSTEWNDSKYHQLLFILSDCLKGLNKPLKSIQMISESLQKFLIAINEYESVNLSGTGTVSSISNSGLNSGIASSGTHSNVSNVNMSEQERITAIKQSGKSWSENLSREEAGAIRDYTGDSCYRNINGVLRGSSQSFNAGNRERARAIESAINSSCIPCDCTVYRGAPTASLGQYQNLSNDELVGRVIIDRGFMSTSLNQGDAHGGDIRLEISVPAGTSGAYVGYLSEYGHCESEVLLNRGQRMQITGARNDMFGNRIISVRIL